MKYSSNELKSKGKELAFLLRHDAEAFEHGLIDHNGWRMVDEISNIKGFSLELLKTIVETNEKKRYEFNDDMTKIRARQGHSIPVDVGLRKENPTSNLYHGTSIKVKDLIMKEGIKKMSRLHVHMSQDIPTAIMVGERHAKGNKVVVFEIDTKQMIEDGIEFYISNNNVWLTDYVDPKYIKLLEE